MAVCVVIDTTTGECIVDGVAESCCLDTPRRTIAAWKRHSPDDVIKLSDVPPRHVVCLRNGIGKTYAARETETDWRLIHVTGGGYINEMRLHRPSWEEIARAAAEVAWRSYPEVAPKEEDDDLDEPIYR